MFGSESKLFPKQSKARGGADNSQYPGQLKGDIPDWKPRYEYDAGIEILAPDSNYYRCTASHYSSALFATDAANWTMFAGPGMLSPDTNFAEDDLIFDANRSHDTAGYSLIISTDGATLNESRFFMDSNAIALTSGNAYTQVAPGGIELSVGGTLFRYESTGLGVGVTGSPIARLEVRAQGTGSSDSVFVVRNSANTGNTFKISGEGGFDLGGASNIAPVKYFRMNDTTSRGVNDIFFDVLGNGAQPAFRAWHTQDGTGATGPAASMGGNSNNFTTRCAAIGLAVNRFYGTNHFAFVGASASAGWVRIGVESNATGRLHVDAQGTLSSDKVIVARNAANDDDIFLVKGNHTIELLGQNQGGIDLVRIGGGSVRMTHRATALLPSQFVIGSTGNGGSVGQITFDALQGDGTYPTFTMQRFISGLSDLTASSLYSGFGTNAACFVMKNSSGYAGLATEPTDVPADHFAMFAKDISAGVSAPHFYIENDRIVKLYQKVDAALGNTINTGDANTDAAITAIINVILDAGLGALV